MPDVLIYADNLRSPEMRHEVAVPIPDPFLYAEKDGKRSAMLTSFEMSRVDDPTLELHPYEEFGYDELVVQMPREQVDLELCLRACRKFGIEDAVVPATFPLQLADFLRENGIKVRSDREFFIQRRRVKSELELEGIRRAQRGAEAGMVRIREMLRDASASNGTLELDGEPLTCERIKVAVEQAFNEHGVAAEEFIVSHGAQTAVGHEMGSGPIAPGEPVVADLFPRDRETGCFADMTRTFVSGEPSEELVEYQRLCRLALDRVLEHVKPGVTGKQLHEIACDVFQEHGYKTQLNKEPGEVLQDGFFHGLGHGVGLEVHEQPWLGRGPGELVAGDVIAIEPGLYRAGYGGCRLEDLVLVTEDGGEVLTDFPYDLEP
ncbi:MAG: Xaa-Pro peptidase family protein [Actinomycetota bacterium]|nr:Xaa-Pro peptidase family protein [Actinomycetota bacterium]